MSDISEEEFNTFLSTLPPVSKGEEMNALTANESVTLEEVKAMPGEELGMIADGAAGAYLAGKGMDMAENALTKKFPATPHIARASQSIVGRAPGFLARHVAPRIAGAIAGTSAGPIGSLMGLVAPELLYQGIDLVTRDNGIPDKFDTPEEYLMADSQSTAVMPSVITEPITMELVVEPDK